MPRCPALGNEVLRDRKHRWQEEQGNQQEMRFGGVWIVRMIKNYMRAYVSNGSYTPIGPPIPVKLSDCSTPCRRAGCKTWKICNGFEIRLSREPLVRIQT